MNGEYWQDVKRDESLAETEILCPTDSRIFFFGIGV